MQKEVQDSVRASERLDAAEKAESESLDSGMSRWCWTATQVAPNPLPRPAFWATSAMEPAPKAVRAAARRMAQTEQAAFGQDRYRRGEVMPWR